MMSIKIRKVQPEVQSIHGFIVYVMADETPIEAEVCELDELKSVVRYFETKYGI